MPAQEHEEQDGGATEDRRADAERARRRAHVFGDVLPEATRDERRTESPEDDGEAAEDWLRHNVPPHHGG